MKKLITFITHRQFLIFVGLVLLSFVVYWLAPEVGYEVERDGREELSFPLGPVHRRWIVIGLMFGTWLLVLFISFARTVLAASKLKEDLVPAQPSQSETQISALESEFGKAVEALEKHSGGKGKRSLVELPWYMVLGPSGVGKTELLRTSGLEFPYEGETNKKYLSGAGGTLNCKWWLTRDAILLDTAGRYVQQDQNREADSAEWQRFLTLLRRTRKKQPLNGVVAVISADDILQDYRSDRESLRIEAQRLRKRIEELQNSFDMRLPVYLLVAKCDLIAGFAEYFRDLNSVDRRAQPLGFDIGDSSPDTESFLVVVQNGMQNLINRLRQRTLTRLHDEHAQQRKAQIQAFPTQVESLMPPLLDFVELAFGYDEVGASCHLRGMYFTSATQIGAPIDQLTSELSEIFGLVETEQSNAGGEGRSFFVRDLLLDKVFPEKALAGESNRWRTASSWALKAAAGFGGLAILVSAFTWFSAYSSNKSMFQQLSTSLTKLESSVPTKEDASDGELLLTYLDDLAEVRRLAIDFEGKKNFLNSLGSGKSTYIREAADSLYRDALDSYFVPYAATYPYEELKASVENTDTSISEIDLASGQYELIRVLRTFEQPRRLNDELNKSRLIYWLESSWDYYYSSDPEYASRLKGHLNFYKDNPIASVNYIDDLVLSAQEGLLFRNKMKLYYEMIRRQAEEEFGGQIDLRRSPNHSMFDSVFRYAGDGSDLIVSGLFTSHGFDQFMKKGYISDFVEERIADSWVLGDDYQMPKLNQVVKEIERLYVGDYIRVWTRALDSLSVRRVSGGYDSRAVINTLVAPSSPLRHLLGTIAEQTSLAQPSDDASNNAGSATQKILRRSKPMKRLKKYGIGAPGAEEQDPREVITEAFAELNALSDGGSGNAPIDNLLQQLAQVLGPLNNAEASSSVFDVMVGLAGGQPEPMRSWLTSLVSSSAQVHGQMVEQGKLEEQAEDRESIERQLRGRFNEDIYPECDTILSSYYPANTYASEDVSLAELETLFGVSGLMAQFTSSDLQGYIDRKRRPWRWAEVQDLGKLNLPTSVLKTLESAVEVRRAYFPLPIRMNVEPGLVDPKITRLYMIIDGQEFDYRQGAMLPVEVSWGGSGGSKGFKMVLTMQDGSSETLVHNGEWGFYRALKGATVSKGDARGTLDVLFEVNGVQAPVRLIVNKSKHPFLNDPLAGFSCQPM